MKFSVIRVPVLAAILGLASPLSLHAGFISHAGASVTQDGSSNFGSNSASASAIGTLYLDDGTAPPPVLYTYDNAAAAFGVPGQYSWALKNFSSGTSGIAAMASESRAIWRDQITVTGGTEPYVTLRFSFKTTGYSEAGRYDQRISGGGSVRHIVAAYVDESIVDAWESYFLSGGRPYEVDELAWSSTFDGGGYDGSGSFTGGGYFDMTFAMSAGASGMLTGANLYEIHSNLWADANNGYAMGNFFGTTVLSSILLLDGSTPESRGYSLSFDSGLLSPNLAPGTPVPEPTSLTLLGSGSIVLAFGAWRRRQRAV